jgi:universal stress protein A
LVSISRDGICLYHPWKKNTKGLLKKGMSIKEMIREGNPIKEILKVIKEEDINLIIMLAHSEWRLVHFLFGRIKEEIIRKMPCSVLLIKEEPGKVAYDD